MVDVTVSKCADWEVEFKQAWRWKFSRLVLKGEGFTVGSFKTCVTKNLLSINWNHGWPPLIGCPQVASKDAFSYSEEMNALWTWVGCGCY